MFDYTYAFLRRNGGEMVMYALTVAALCYGSVYAGVPAMIVYAWWLRDRWSIQRGEFARRVLHTMPPLPRTDGERVIAEAVDTDARVRRRRTAMADAMAAAATTEPPTQPVAPST